MAVLAVAAALVLVLQLAPDAHAYVTGAPVPQWLGLATLEGRDAIQLGDGCADVAPGVNVVLDGDGALRVVDPIKGVEPNTCELAQRVHVSDVPCATSRLGICDVAFS